MRPRASVLRAAAVAVGLVLLVWVQREASQVAITTAETALVVVLPISAAVGVFLAAAGRSRWVLAAGVLVAISPTVLTQFGAGQRHGAVAIVALMAGLAVGPTARRSTSLAVAGVLVLSGGAMVSWWRVTPAREGTAPSWSANAQSIGTYVERAVGGLGADAFPAPTTAALAWWLAAGIVIGAATATARRAALAVPAAALGVFVVACMAIERWRGPVNPIAGAWLLSGTVGYVASRAQLPRLASGRTAVAVGVLVAWSWSWSVAALIRLVATDETQPAAWSRWLDWGSAAGGRTASLLLPVAAVGGVAVAAATWWPNGRSGDPRGVNVVGYHSITGGLGERTRELTSCLEAAGVDVAAYDLPVDSERDHALVATPDRRFATTVVVTPAFEVEDAAAAHPDLFRRRRLVAGYWFWELDGVPPSHRSALELVDEVWAPTRFVRDAYRRATLLPVRHVPIPIPEPSVAPLGRADLGLPEDACVFLVSFSHLSVMERKNPLDAIAAFREAFPPADRDAGRHRLVVKTLNADRKPDDADVLRAAALGDERIEIRDARMGHPELMALVAASDVFVSLHRSEGLGLQIADAMWLGTPVIATDYSGSRDLAEIGFAELVPWHPTPVRKGDGAYPESFTWAQPDLHAAAISMRRLARDPVRRRHLAEAARRRMAAQPDRVAAGRALAKLARCR